MAVTVGTRLGAYEVIGALGGGMGEVYRARDTRLERDVAIKILPPLFAAVPMPLPEVLDIAKQMSLALEAAHELGIVHRDLKPANVRRREDGSIRILDFGLAKAMAPETVLGADGTLANSPTMTSPATTCRCQVTVRQSRSSASPASSPSGSRQMAPARRIPLTTCSTRARMR